MQAKCRIRIAAAVSLCALLSWGAQPARAHRDQVHPDAAPTPAVVTPVPNRWGADYFPNVPLIAQDGTTLRFYDDLLKGKSVAINVIYTSCKDECPLETARLVQLQQILGDRVGKEIFFYSISIDPENDTPQVLKAYAEKYGVGPGWLFLTGAPEDIKLAVKKIGLSRGSDRQNRDGHTASLMVGKVPAGLWMRNSAVDNPQFLADTIGVFLGWRDRAPQKSYAEARPLDIGLGEHLFISRCTACHTLGQGDKLGPDLLGVTARRERAWIARYIVEPAKMLQERDPIAVSLHEKYPSVRMPNQSLGSGDVAAVISYLESRQGAATVQIGKDSASDR
jgi:protein SCO1/2